MNLSCFWAWRRTIIGSALALVLLCNFHGTCTNTSLSKSQKGNSKDGHLEMLKSLKQIAGKIDVPQNGYAAKVKLAYLDQLMSSSTTQQERLNNVMKKGIVLLEYGDEVNAVAIFEKISQYVGDNPKARFQHYIGLERLICGLQSATIVLPATQRMPAFFLYRLQAFIKTNHPVAKQ